MVRSHNREFTAKLEELGIYSTTGHGAHYKPADRNKPFGILVKEWGIIRVDAPEHFKEEPKIDWWKFFEELFGKPVPKGRSSLTKYACPECGLAVRVGIKGDPQMLHDPCSHKTGKKVFFVRADTVSQVIYTASQEK